MELVSKLQSRYVSVLLCREVDHFKITRHIPIPNTRGRRQSSLHISCFFTLSASM